MALSAYQWVFEIALFRQKVERSHGKLSNSDVAKLYQTNGGLAPETEQVTENMVEQATQVFKQVLALEGVHQVIARAEERLGKNSPFNTVNKICQIARKVRDNVKDNAELTNTNIAMDWAFRAIMDWVECSLIDPSEITVRGILGQSTGGKSFVDLICLKLALKNYLLDIWLNNHAVGIDATVKTELRQVFGSHESFRGLFGDGKSAPDLTWQGTWNKSSVRVAEFIKARCRKDGWQWRDLGSLCFFMQAAETQTLAQSSDAARASRQELVYGNLHDQALKMSLRGGRKSSAEILELPALADVVSELNELMEADSGKAKVQDDEDEGDESGEAKDEDKGAATENTGILENLDKLTADDKVRVSKFKKQAEETVTRHVKLIAEPATSGALANVLKASLLATSKNDKKIVIFYDVKLSGEAATHPHIRKPPFRAAHYKKLVSAVMESRPDGMAAIHPEDIFVIFDGGKHGPSLKV